MSWTTPISTAPTPPPPMKLPLDELEVIGELPEDLFGAYYRNGPNPVFKPKNLYHPFDGDGMVHAVYIRDGKASYRNSYIHTYALQRELAENQAVWPGVMGPFDFSLPDSPIKDTGNTDVILFNGQLLPTWYNAGVPYSMNPLTSGKPRACLTSRAAPDARCRPIAMWTGTQASYYLWTTATRRPL